MRTEQQLRDGQVVVRSGQRPRGLPLLVQGEVACWRGKRLVGFREAPAVLEASAVVHGRPARSTWNAVGDSTVAWVSPEEVPTEQWVQWLASELERAEDQVVDDVRCQDDFWDPGARLVPGPYRFGPFDATVLLLQSDRAHVRSLLPPGLVPVPGLGGRHVVVVADLEGVVSLSRRSDGRAWAYRETTPLLPCLRETGGGGMYVPELYPDAYMPILLGRETYGFPKRLARTRAWDGGTDVIVDHRRLVRLRWQEADDTPVEEAIADLCAALCPWLPASAAALAGRAAPAATRLPMPVYVRRRRIDPRRPERLVADELVRIPFRFAAVERASRLRRVDLRLDPQQSVLCGDLVGAWRVRTGFSFAEASVCRNYRRSVRARVLGR